MTKARWRTSGARIRLGSSGWTPRDSLSTVTLENAVLRCTFSPSHGTEILEFVDKRQDRDWVGYASSGPAGRADNVAATAHATFLDGYSGGWQLVVPNGGEPSVYRGAVLGQHAEASSLAWETSILADSDDEVVVACSVDLVRMPLTIERRFRLRAEAKLLEVTETVSNTSDVDLDIMWGEHLAFGPAILAGGVSVELSASASVIAGEGEGAPPDLSAIDATVPVSAITYYRVPDGRYVLRRARGGTLRVAWDAAVQPFLWVWREFAHASGYPFWGSHTALGLEPFAGMPTHGLAAAVDNGTALKIVRGASVTTTWSVEILDD